MKLTLEIAKIIIDVIVIVMNLGFEVQPYENVR